MTALAYLAGVLNGDGYCNKVIGLHVKDLDFAKTFAVALELETGCIARPRRDGGYWRVAATNGTGRFSAIKTYQPEGDAERASWLRGLFDSEGSTQLSKHPTGGWRRRVGFYSTNHATLALALNFLQCLGIVASIAPQSPSASHLGTRQVYELALAQSRENFLRFAWLIGSSIGRKRDVLFALPLSYQVDPVASMRSAQKIGAAAKHRKTIEVTLPAVLEGIRALIADGTKPTQRACMNIPGYPSVQRHYRQAQLLAMARAES